MWTSIEGSPVVHLSPSQPGSFVVFCHSLICCIAGSHVVWLTLKNCYNNQLSAGNGFLWVKKEQPPTPAMLCWMHWASSSGSLGSSFWYFEWRKRSLTIFDGSCWGRTWPIFRYVYHSKRSPEYFFQHYWGIWVTMTMFSISVIHTLESALFLLPKSLW